MTNANAEKLAMEVIPLLKEMFGEGIEFSYTEFCQSNEVLAGITLHLPSCSNVPVVCLSDMPDDISAKEAAGIAAATFQSALREFEKTVPAIPEMTRDNILKNVVLQALSRKRNRQLLKAHPYIPFLDLAGIFRIPLEPYERHSLTTAFISNQVFKDFGLTVDELAETARRNTIKKFGIQLISTQEMMQYFTKGEHQEPKPFDEVQMTSPGLYTLTNGIEINGAALMLIPEVLEALGEKAGMDYYILPSSIHDLLIVRDDGSVSAKHLKENVYAGNRTPGVIKPEEVLSDNVYRYCRKDKSLKIV